MKDSTDDIQVLDRLLSKVSAALSTPPDLDRIERRVQHLRRAAQVQVGFGAACFAALIAFALAFGLRDGGIIFLVGIMELTYGLSTLLCIRERQMGEITDEVFMFATRKKVALARYFMIFPLSVMLAIYVIGMIQGPIETIDAVLAAFHLIVITYEVWMIGAERRSHPAPAQRSPKL